MTEGALGNETYAEPLRTSRPLDSGGDAESPGFQRLNACDWAVLAEIPKITTPLWDTYGYPNHKAVDEIAGLSSRDETDVYDSLKFLRIHKLLGTMNDEPDAEAIAEFERAPVKSEVAFYDLAATLARRAEGDPGSERITIKAEPLASNPVDQLIDDAVVKYLKRDGSRTEYSAEDVMFVLEPLFGVIEQLCVVLDHTSVGPPPNKLSKECKLTWGATAARARATFKLRDDERFNYLSVQLAASAILDDIHNLRRCYQGTLTRQELAALLDEAPAHVVIVNDPLLEIPSAYPLRAWDGTAYAQFATICTRGNYIPPEFFIEALKTVVGGVAGHLLGVADSEVEGRFYTPLIGEAGKGKSTAINWALEVFPSSLVYTSGFPYWRGIGCWVGGFGSQVGLIKKAKDHRQILQVYDELSTLADKFRITGSGLSFLSLLNALYEKTLPPSNVTKDAAPDLEHPLHNSILGATTPDVWERTFGGTGSEGSGFFQRLNIVGSEERRAVPRLTKPDLKQFDPLVKAVKALAEKPYLLPMNEAADRLMKQWFDGLAKQAGDTDTGRLQGLALRNAAHIGWLLNVRTGQLNTVEPEEVIKRALALSNYQLTMRRKYQPVTGDTPWAQMENLISRYVQQAGVITRKDLYRRVHASRYGLKVFNNGLEALAREGLITIEDVKQTRHKVQMIHWLGN